MLHSTVISVPGLTSKASYEQNGTINFKKTTHYIQAMHQKTITRYFADHLTQTKCCPNSSFSIHNLTDTNWRYKKSDSFTTTTTTNGKASYNFLNHSELNLTPSLTFKSNTKQMGPPPSQNFSHYIPPMPRNLTTHASLNHNQMLPKF